MSWQWLNQFIHNHILTRHKDNSDLVSLMQISNMMISDINVLWSFMHMCILDQHQCHLIVFIQLKWWICSVHLIFVNLNVSWITVKILAQSYVSKYLNESDACLHTHEHHHVLSLCCWCDNKLLLLTCSWDWFFTQHVNLFKNWSSILLVWHVVRVRVSDEILTLTRFICDIKVNDWANIS